MTPKPQTKKKIQVITTTKDLINLLKIAEEQATLKAKQELWDDIEKVFGIELNYWYDRYLKEIKKRHNLK